MNPVELLERDLQDKDKVFYVSSDGQLYSYDRANYAQIASAQQLGFRPATMEDVERRKNELLYGDSPIRAGLAGAARGFTVGLSDVALTKTGLVQPETLAGLEEANPEASITGEIGGTAASLLVPGLGEAAAAKTGAQTAVRGATALPRAIAGAGKAVEAGVTGIAGTGAAARIAGKAAGGAVEGAAYGAGQALTEDALGRHDLTAEYLLAQAGLGALVGGAATGALGLGFEAVKAAPNLSAKAYEALYEKTFGRKPAEGFGDEARDWLEGGVVRGEWEDDAVKMTEGPDGRPIVVDKGSIGDWAREKYAKAASMATGADETKIHSFIRKGEAGKLARERATKTEDAFNGEVRSFVDASDKLAKESDALFERAVGNAKASRFKGMVEADEISDVVAYRRAREVVDDVGVRLQKMIQAGDSRYGYPVKLDAIKALVDDAVTDIGRTGSAGDKYIILDRLKRNIGSVRAKLKPTDLGPQQETQEQLTSIYDALKSSLEDVDTWGPKAATAQQKINEKWTRYLGPENYRNDFFVAHGKDGFLNLYEANPRKFDSFARALGTVKNDLDDKYITEHFRSRRELAEEIAKHYDLADADKALLEKVRIHSKIWNATLHDLRQSVSKRNQLQELLQAQPAFGGVLQTGLSGMVGGAVLGGPLGAAAGGLLGAGLAAGVKAVNQPGKVIQQLAALDRLTGTFKTKYQQRIDGFVKKAKTAGKVVEREAGRVVAPASVQSLQDTTFGGRRSKNASRQQAYRARLGELSQLAANPEALSQRLTAATAGLGEVAPKTRALLQAKALGALQFLLAKAPKAPEARGPFAYPWQPSETELAKWARYVAAVEDPTTVLDDLNEGRLTREGVEALRAVYPEIYAELQLAFVERVSDLQATLPYAQRVQLSILFQVPLDRSLQPGVLQALQATHAPKEPEKPQGAPSRASSLRFAESAQTELSKLAFS